MATETLLFLDPPHEIILDNYIEAIRHEIIRSHDIPERLIRNYLLILSRYADKAAVEDLMSMIVAENPADHTLRQVATAIMSGERIALFDYEEPGKLRR